MIFVKTTEINCSAWLSLTWNWCWGLYWSVVLRVSILLVTAQAPQWQSAYQTVIWGKLDKIIATKGGWCKTEPHNWQSHHEIWSKTIFYCFFSWGTTSMCLTTHILQFMVYVLAKQVRGGGAINRAFFRFMLWISL